MDTSKRSPAILCPPSNSRGRWSELHGHDGSPRQQSRSSDLDSDGRNLAAASEGSRGCRPGIGRGFFEHRDSGEFCYHMMTDSGREVDSFDAVNCIFAYRGCRHPETSEHQDGHEPPCGHCWPMQLAGAKAGGTGVQPAALQLTRASS